MIKNYRQAMTSGANSQEDKSQESIGANSLALAIAKGRKDPVFFGEYFLGLHFHSRQKIWLWLTTKTKIKEAYELAIEENIPLPKLEKLLEHRFLKNILAPGNRFGKTFVTSVKHIWYNFYKIGCTGNPAYIHDIRYSTLNISPHSMQVDAAYRYIVDIFSDKLIYEWDGKKVRNECKIKSFLIDHKQIKREIVFNNNSMIKGVPTGEDQASSLAGTQFFYISYDEAPQSLHLRKELPAKIQSRLLDSGGPMDIIGTPEVDKPSHTYYQRIVKLGMDLKDGFFTMIGGIANNIFIGTEEKESILESIKQTDKEKYRQVAFGDFISSGAKLIPTVAIDRMWDSQIHKLEMGQPGREYIISADWGFSDTGDPSVFYVIDITDLLDSIGKNEKTNKVLYKVVLRESIKGGSPYAVLARFKILQQDFNDARLIHDSSSMGGVMIKKMLHEMKVGKIYDFATSKNPKDEMLFLLVRALTHNRQVKVDDDGKVTELNENFGKVRSYYIPELEEQLGNYRVDDSKLEQDEVMSFGMAIWYCERKLAGHKTKVFDLNILADKPQQVLKISGISDKEAAIKTRTFNITERHFG